jgi:hypothetical protein
MNPWPEEGAPGDAPPETILPFEDLILAPGATLDHLLHRQMPVLATLRHRRFATETFEEPHALGVRFALRAPLPLPDGDRHLELTKTFRLDDQQCRLTLDLELANPEPRPLELSYGLRLPLASLASPHGHPFTLTVPEVGLTDLDGLSVGEVCGISTLRWGPRPGGPPPERGALPLASTRLTIDRPVTVWYSPLLTEIMLEGKATPIFQALVLVFLVQLRLDREGRAGLRFTFTLGKGSDHG